MRQIATVIIGAMLAVAQMPAVQAQRAGNAGSQTPSTSKPAAPASTQKPAPRPAPAQTTKPAPPAPAATAKPAPPPAAPAPPPPPQDARFKVVYRADGVATETTIYAKGERQRYEFTDMVLLQQPDQKRTVQISLPAKTYYVTPMVDSAAGTGAQAPAANVRVVTTIIDTGERKTLFGQEARRVKTMIDKQPLPGACDMSKQRVETDGWYVDPPAVMARQDNPMASMAGNTTCQDVITATVSGDPKLLGFPMTYSTSVTTDAGAPSTVAMEVTEFDLTTLDAALFEVPPGMNAALNLGEMGKAVSDINESKLAAMNATPPATPVAPKPGVVRVGVAELTNKTDQRVDTRVLRTQLSTSLESSKVETMPLAAATQEELLKRAAAQGLSYVVMAEVTELKVSKPGGLGGALRAATGALNTTNPGETPKPPTEASLNVRLLQAADGKQRMSKSVKGNNGGGLAGAGLGAAKLAGGVASGMLMGPRMFAQMYRLNSAFGPNLGGFGLLGNPSFFRLQTMSMGVGGYGGGRIDRAAGAAAFVMEQSAAMSAAASAVPAGATSFDEALTEALDKATKEIVGALPK